MAAITGWRWMTPAHRSAAGSLGSPERVVLPRIQAGGLTRDGLASRVPLKPSRAGSRVSEASRTMATVAAAATATPFSRAWRRMRRPSIPITTVVPATSTDRPAVRIAVTAAASGAVPARRLSLNRVTMNSA